jgi:amino acid adenylation domain-containing protein/non-ribosomal peptide synthase protein (TIGR01720 family)
MHTTDLKGSPLSVQQTRLWSLQGDNLTYRALCAILIKREIDDNLLQRALQHLVDRHEILRTVFYRLYKKNAIVQLVREHLKQRCCVIDLERVHQKDQLPDELIAQCRIDSYDMTEGPLFHTWLLHLSPYTSMLVLSLPALCADTSTLQLIVAELLQNSTSQYQPPSSGEELLQYADVAAWQDELLQEPDAEAHRQYWQKIDLRALTTMHLPFEHENSGNWHSSPFWHHTEFAPQSYNIFVPHPLSARMQSIAHSYGVTPSAFLLTCWQILHWRLTGDTTFLIGVACNGRHYEELKNALGPYTRFVPIEADFTRDHSFKHVLDAVNMALQEAQTQQAYFVWDIPLDEQGSNFFPVSYEYDRWSILPSTYPNSPYQCISHIEPFLLKLSALEIGSRLQMILHYDPRFLTTEHIHRLSTHLLVLLESAIADPLALVSRLRLLAHDEQVRLQQTFQGPARELPDSALPQLFEEHVNTTPDSLAVVSNEEQLTYQCLNNYANRLAHLLRRRGVGPNVCVGLCLSRSVWMPVGLLAILKAGGAYVPLDPDSPRPRMSYQLHNARVSLLLTEQALLSQLPTLEHGQVLCLEMLRDEMAKQSANNLPPQSSIHDLTYVIYTSGSTGIPKGVSISQQNVLHYISALCPLIASERGWHFATVSTLAADLGNTAIFCSLASGGCLHILPYETITSAEAFARSQHEWPVDVLKIVPSHLSTLLSTDTLEDADDILPQRYLILGGEALPISLLRRFHWQKRRYQVFNHYGPTETTIGALVNQLGTLATETIQAGQNDIVPLGAPIANTEAYVLDQQLQIVPVGVTGEIYLAGSGLASGYLNQPGQTAESFVPHPFAHKPGMRLYKTGDLARYTPQGQIEFVGRRDNQVKLRGYRIEPDEIEVALRSHTEVRDAVVLLREDRPGEAQLVAYVVVGAQSSLNSGEFSDFLRQRIPTYMVPSSFVFLQSLPLTANGKIDRRRLPQPEAWQGEVRSMVMPRTPVEELLVDIWKKVLHLTTLGVEDNFFALGGHSLLAMQIASRIRAVLQVEIPIRSLFEAPTIAALAQQVEQALRVTHVNELPMLTPAPRSCPLPLSFAQQRLWFLDQFEPGNTSYSKTITWYLRGTLNRKAFEQSLKALVERHETLRTVFQIQQSQPVQVIMSADTFLLPIADLRGLAPAYHKTEAMRLTTQEAQRPFSLAQGPLLRVRLLQLSEEEHVLIFNMHHIISDGWSNDIFIQELSLLYQAFRDGKPSPLVPLPIQYADFAIWQRTWLQGEELQRQLDYWSRQLAHVPTLQLPTDYPRPPVQTFRGAGQSAFIPLRLYEGLKGLSQRAGVTLFMLLLAAFKVLLLRYTSQTDIAVGTPIANRIRPELEGLIGFFVNTLVLRTDLSDNPTFLDLLARLREVTLSAYAHQDVPFEQLVEALQPERHLNRSPFFQVMFGVQQEASTLATLAGLTIEDLSTEHTVSKFDLTWSIVDTAMGLRCEVEYSTDLFTDSTINAMLAHWHMLLQGIVEAPHARVADLPLLDPSECEFLLHDWNNTSAPVSTAAESYVHTLFAAQAAVAPDAIAVVTAEHTLSYAELNRRANQLAHYLQTLGVGPEVLVGIVSERSVLWLISLLAVLKAGGGYVPLDPGYPQARLDFMLNDAQVSLLLTERRTQADPFKNTRRVICLEDIWEQIVYCPESGPNSHVDVENIAYVVYTSGSTGTPKGVQVTQRGLGNLAKVQAEAFAVRPESHVLQFASQSFDASVSEVLVTLLVGASLYLAPHDRRLSGPGLLALLGEWAITVVTLPPSLLAILPQEPLPLLKTLVVAGENCPIDLVSRWATERRFCNAYGPTEATVCASIAIYTAQEVPQHISIGKPIANTQLYVLDEHLHLVPIGVPGELYIGGIGIARGYLKRADLTAERFIPCPFGDQPGSRLYKTGDRVRLRPDGTLEFLGRLDEQVKIRGNRIELGEIAAQLEQYAGIRECVVSVHEDTAEDHRLVAYLVIDPTIREPVISEVRAYLQQRLPDYMIPSHIVVLEQLPLLPNGKIDRRSLPTPEAQTARLRGDPSGRTRTPIEATILDIWEAVLDYEEIGVHDNFFDLGGHSLLATQLMARVQAVLGVDLPVRSLFEAPTISELARLVEQEVRGQQGHDAALLVAQPRPQDLPLSFAQQRLWFFDQLEPESAAYLIPGAVWMQGRLNISALEQSISALIQRHESLRTTFQEKDGQPVQIIHSDSSCVLPVIDLSALWQEQRTVIARKLAAQEAQRPCNLQQGPLLRVNLLRLAVREHVLLLTMHHIISDGWSGEIFVRELTTLYQAYSNNQSLQLPALPIQYADFVLWQRSWLQGKVLQAQMDYWRQQLAVVPPVELLTDYPRPPFQTFHGACLSVSLSHDLHTRLSTLSQQQGVTLFMLLLAAFQILLARYTGQIDIAVGTPIANRTRTELEGLIGFFVNVLVIRTDLSDNPTFLDVLAHVRNTTLEAYAHQDIPFEQLVEVLQPERDLSRSPLFQVMFSLQKTLALSSMLADLTINEFPVESTIAKFDLAFMMLESTHDFTCEVQYNTDLFEAASIQRMLRHWHTLLQGIVEAPQSRLADLPLLSEQEQSLEMIDWNATHLSFPAERCLHTLVEQQAARTPDAIALVFGHTCLSYGALNQYANQYARVLLSLGLVAGTPIALFVERTFPGMIALLAILKIGGILVVLDPSAPSQRLQDILEETATPLVLTQSSMQPLLPIGLAQLLCVENLWAVTRTFPAHDLPAHASADELAYLAYTSGSTGRPKGVMVSHRAITNRLWWGVQDVMLQSDDRVLQVATWSFDIALWELFGPLMVGATCILLTSEEARESLAILAHMQEQQITVAHFVPSLLSVLVELPDLASCKHMRAVLCGGEAVSLELVRRLQRLLSIAVHQFYGPTEAAISVTSWHALPQQPVEHISLGHPIANTQIYLVDRFGQLVAPGMRGEIWIAGENLASGYWQQPALTAERFVPNPFSVQPGARAYRTGDLGRYHGNGEIMFGGRLDKQVKIRGNRVEPGEVEAVLARHPQVQECVVVARHDQAGVASLIAYVAAPEQSTSSMALRTYLRERLPEYMVPAAFVLLPVLPVTANGKIDYQALSTEIDIQQRQDNIIPARTPIEEIIAEHWGDLLEYGPVSIYDNFFDVGGHSLLATRLMARVRNRLNVGVPLRTLFEAPTLVDLARRVEQIMHGEQWNTIPPLVAVPRTQDFPLSFAQQRLWFLDQLDPGSITYLVPVAKRLQGVLHIQALDRSLQALIQRHEILRTTFEEKNGYPLQIVHPATSLPLPLTDLSGLTDKSRMAEARRLVYQEAHQPCNLSEGPLLRMHLLRLGPNDHIVLQTMHHIITDGWSSSLFICELAILYRAFVHDQVPPLAPLSIQYADYALWQQQWLQGATLQAHLHYWQKQLANVPVLELPTDYPRPPAQTFRGDLLSICLPDDLHQKLMALSQREGVTLFITLLAAFQVLLMRYSGQTDIAVGSSIANRTHAELENLLGFFVNTMVLRTDLSGNPSFTELLKRVREVALGAYAHQDVPFEQVVEVLQPERHLDRSPLFQVMFTFENVPKTTSILEGLTLSDFFDEPTGAKFDLTVVMDETARNLDCRIEYNADIFAASTMKRLLAQWQILLESIVAAPQRRLSDLSFLIHEEKHLLLHEWNTKITAFPEHACIHDLFEMQAAERSDAVSVVFDGCHITYAVLNQRANSVAHRLHRLGIGPDVLVGISVERSLEMIIGILGILKAGGAFLPLDPSYPHTRLVLLLENAGVSTVVTQERFVPQWSSLSLHVVSLDEDWSPTSEHILRRNASAENLAYVMYTSGSTGTPKGVMVPHRAVVRLVKGNTFARLDAHEVFLQAAPLGFDASTFEIWGCLLNGGRLVVFPPFQPTLDELSSVLRQEAVTTLWLTAGLFHQMVEEQLDALLQVKHLLAGGDVLSVEHVKRVLQEDSGIILINGYGPTENATFTCCYPMITWEQIGNSVPIGYPIANTSVYILDAFLQPVPIGVTGELYTGGYGMARGYFNEPGWTAEKFIPHPFEVGTRLYRTGDLARYLPDGTIEFLGRVDRQVKIRGYRIEQGEIEVVLGQHLSVHECIVLERKNEHGDSYLVAYVTGEDGTLESSSLRAYLRERVPEYMVPQFFVALQVFPLTPNGKVDRRALPAPENVVVDAVVAPRTPIEQSLAQIWEEVLEQPAVSIHANFFEIGGHSLLATRLISRIRAVFLIELPLRILFEKPTISELAQHVQQALREDRKEDVPPLGPMPHAHYIPLSFAQQRLWFLDQLEPESAAYLLPSAHRLYGPLNTIALEQSFDLLVQRHESLRTTFELSESQPVQIIHPAYRFVLPAIDLRALASEQRDVTARQLAEQEAQHPCNLTSGPLMRAYLIRQDREDHILLVTLHHIITDGWSNEVLLRELTALYQARVENRPSPLSPLPIQYADFTLWQRMWLQNEILQKQLEYWTQQLAELSTLELPTDHPRPAIQTFNGADLSIELSSTLHQQLTALGQQVRATLFMTLLTAFQVLLARYSGQTDIAVGTPIANRTHAELEGLIGFFVNTLVIRTNMSDNPTFLELLERVRDIALGAYAHQDIPFEQLVEVLQPVRDLSRSPLFQVMFSVQKSSEDAETLKDLSLVRMNVGLTTTKFELSMTLIETEQGLHCVIQYNTDLFEQENIQQMLERWQTLLEGIVAAPHTRLSDLPLLSTWQRSVQIFDWNATAASLPTECCLHIMVEQQVTRTPDAVALVSDDMHLTYAALNGYANQLARYLRFLGIELQTPIALCVERTCIGMIALLAIFKIGGILVPLDPSTPALRLTKIIEEAAAPIALVQCSIQQQVCVATPCLLCVDTCWQNFVTQPSHNLPHHITADDLAYIAYTSGSTGQPKGVMVSHRAIANRLWWGVNDVLLQPSDSIVQIATWSFDIALWELFGPLIVGARCLIVKRDEVKDSAILIERLQQHQITVAHFVPSLLNALLQEPALASCTSLRCVLCGGEAVSLDLVHRFFLLLPIPIHQFYGPTEASISVTSWHAFPQQPVEHISLGHPIANTQIYLVDRFWQLVAPDMRGEIWIAGENLASGYWQQPALTAERFVPNPFSVQPGARAYRTGDLGRYRGNGEIVFGGRLDEQVKIRGNRVEPGEVEAVLARHPQVGACVVLVQDDDIGNKHLAAYVAGQEPQNQFNVEELRRYLHERLPEYMVPTYFIPLEELPLMSNGKVNRKALSTLVWEHPSATEYCAPRTVIEERLATIWAEVLKVKQVGIHDNFFSLGGDSILSIQIIARARQSGLQFTPKQLFQYQTIAALSSIVSANMLSHAEQGPVLGAVPLTPVQHAFFEQQLPEPHYWNQSRLLKLKQKSSAGVLENALVSLLIHHDALRMSFTRQEHQWQQINLSPVQQLSFLHVDVSSLSLDRQDGSIESIAAYAQKSFHLSGPLVRALFFETGEAQEQVLLIIIHHLVVDTVSWSILLEDLETAYLQLSEGRDVQLPLKTTSFKQWAESLVAYAQSDTSVQELAYWLDETRARVVPLPLDYPGATRVHAFTSTSSVHIAFSHAETDALLKDLSSMYHIQIHELLLAALAQSLARWTGWPHILIDLEGHGREDIIAEADVSRTVGWFTSLFPILLEVPGTSDVIEMVKNIQEQLRCIPNKGIGYGILRHLCHDPAITRLLQERQKPEILFNYLGQLDPVAPARHLFGPASLSAGSDHSTKGNHTHLIEVNAGVRNGQLHVQWAYSTDLHKQSTIEWLAMTQSAILRSFIDQCQALTTEGYVREDFPDVELSQEQLEQVLAEIDFDGGD